LSHNHFENNKSHLTEEKYLGKDDRVGCETIRKTVNHHLGIREEDPRCAPTQQDDRQESTLVYYYPQYDGLLSGGEWSLYANLRPQQHKRSGEPVGQEYNENFEQECNQNAEQEYNKTAEQEYSENDEQEYNENAEQDYDEEVEGFQVYCNGRLLPSRSRPGVDDGPPKYVMHSFDYT
jgi:hypothetical protein